MKYDFCGYATKNDLRCADGRIICRDAFRGNDGQTVPLVWSHQHADPDLVLGHALLENRPDGVYTYCSFNDTPKGKVAKELVKHGDVACFSIFANHLKQDGPSVMHGNIVEVSLVLSGANPGAKIENAVLNHGDGFYEDIDEEATIYNSANIELPEDHLSHADDGKDEDKKDSEKKETQVADDKKEEPKQDESKKSEDRTVKDVLDTMNEEQLKTVEFLVGMAVQEDPNDHVDDDVDEDDDKLQNGGNTVAHHNVFEGNTETFADIDADGLFHAAFEDAKRSGGRFKDAFLRHAEEYGVKLGDDTSTYDTTIAHADLDYGLANPEIVFPNAQWYTKEPEVINYDQTWVNKVMSGIGKTPFSRVRTHDADIRIEEARARGYVKASEKAEGFYKIAKRETTPTTVYTKQKFNRDDIEDITDFSVVNYTRTNIMRPKLNEEIARAILFGDGRAASSQDKINETNIRPIVLDDDHYTVHTVLGSTLDDVYPMIEEISGSHNLFKGRGHVTFFTTFAIHNKMKWAKDIQKHRVYSNGDAELIGDLNVNEIVDVDTFMDNLVIDYNDAKYRVVGIKVALGDYNVGTDRGNNIFNAEDFDIDFNQYKFLMETRMSGALTRFHSAQVFMIPVGASPASVSETRSSGKTN